jgi:hypothetical protein
VDVLGGFTSFVWSLKTGDFANEYEFEFALYGLYPTTHDRHFKYLPSLVAGVFDFGRPLAIVSVSSDGDCLPKPHIYSDILLSLNVRLLGIWFLLRFSSLLLAGLRI